MKNSFWKIISVCVLVAWGATLYTWHAVKTASPRYVECGVFTIDTKENTYFHKDYRRWMKCAISLGKPSDEKTNIWQYIHEVVGLGLSDLEIINPDISKYAPTIVENLDQNKFTAQELRDAFYEFDFKKYNELIDREIELERSPNESLIDKLLGKREAEKRANTYVQANIQEFINSYNIHNIYIRKIFNLKEPL